MLLGVALDYCSHLSKVIKKQIRHASEARGLGELGLAAEQPAFGVKPAEAVWGSGQDSSSSFRDQQGAGSEKPSTALLCLFPVIRTQRAQELFPRGARGGE